MANRGKKNLQNTKMEIIPVIRGKNDFLFFFISKGKKRNIRRQKSKNATLLQTTNI